MGLVSENPVLSSTPRRVPPHPGGPWATAKSGLDRAHPCPAQGLPWDMLAAICIKGFRSGRGGPLLVGARLRARTITERRSRGGPGTCMLGCTQPVGTQRGAAVWGLGLMLWRRPQWSLIPPGGLIPQAKLSLELQGQVWGLREQGDLGVKEKEENFPGGPRVPLESPKVPAGPALCPCQSDSGWPSPTLTLSPPPKGAMTLWPPLPPPPRESMTLCPQAEAPSILQAETH